MGNKSRYKSSSIFDMQFITSSISTTLVLLPVSYTHLDVYKRQVVGDSQRAGAAEFDTSFTNQTAHGVLNNFSVHFECGNRFVTSQRTEYGVGDVSYALSLIHI